MRIYLPILALILAICLRFSPFSWPDKDGLSIQPPLPPAVLSTIYLNAAANATDDEADAMPTTVPVPATAPASLNCREPNDDEHLPAQPQ
jgi:hypothetical protein